MSNDLINQQLEEPTSLVMLADLRQRVLDGEAVSSEEYARVLAQLRRSRTAAPTAKRGAKPVVEHNPEGDFG